MRLILTLSALMLVIAGCGDDDADLGDGGSAGVGGGGATDAGDGDGDGDEDTGVGEDEADTDADVPECTTDSDCTDGIRCTGEERCIAGRCGAGEPPACSPEHVCIEATGRCDCSDPNVDEDDYDAAECGGNDCDDGEFAIHPLATEICRPGSESVDEDCKPETFQNDETNDGDADNDGQVSTACYNLAPDGTRFGGRDCIDDNPDAYEGGTEECDYVDNDCDHRTDEGKPRIQFFPDIDRDGYGDQSAPALERCEYFAPPGHVPGDHPADCDDTEIDVNIAEVELCDGVDNDCDGLIDTDDDNAQPLLKPIEFTDTVVRCMPPAEGETPTWLITDCPGEPGGSDETLWCSGIVELGCATDGTTLSDCRDCDNHCLYACGREDCDEVQGLALGADHSCAVTREGTVACWGYGVLGRIGDGESLSKATPTELLRLPQAKAIGSGPDVSCAVLGDAREVFCWGNNASDLLANSDVGAFSPFPVPVNGIETSVLDGIDMVAVAGKHVCAARETGELFCWGDSLNGRLGNEAFTHVLWDFPVEVMREGGQPVTDADEIAVGGAHSCLITFDGGLECWGDNTEGQLGNPDFTEPYSDFVRPVPGFTDVEQVVAGGAHTCVLSAGAVSCWGLNSSSQLGRESDELDSVPGPVEGLNDISVLTAGYMFTCALDTDGDVWCWGSNGQGQLGADDIAESPEPHRVEIDDAVVALAAGDDHACAVTANKGTYCWGDNTLGQLGLGQSSYEDVIVPEQIQPLDRSRR